jgi:hypothetical protein
MYLYNFHDFLVLYTCETLKFHPLMKGRLIYRIEGKGKVVPVLK